MKPYVVGGACHRVYMLLDEALSIGEFHLPAELSAHAGACPRCSREVQRTESLLGRLRQAPATMELGPVPAVVDTVLASIAVEPERRKASHSRWLIAQVAAAAAVILLGAGVLTLTGLMVGEVVRGGDAGSVLTKLIQPFMDWTVALFSRSR